MDKYIGFEVDIKKTVACVIQKDEKSGPRRGVKEHSTRPAFRAPIDPVVGYDGQIM